MLSRLLLPYWLFFLLAPSVLIVGRRFFVFPAQTDAAQIDLLLRVISLMLLALGALSCWV